jgi:hypothetical protein
MAVASEFKAYAKKLGFPDSETMGRIWIYCSRMSPVEKLSRP